MTSLEYLKKEQFGNINSSVNNDRQELEESSKKNNMEEKKPGEFTQKYSEKDILIESVLIDNLPYFLISKNGEITIEKHFELSTKILRPYEFHSYVNKPYSFSSKSEVQKYINEGKKESLDSLYSDVKSKWKKYVDADDFHISICAADTIFTYFQDKIGLTHYLFFVGNNGSGKSNNLTLLHISL